MKLSDRVSRDEFPGMMALPLFPPAQKLLKLCKPIRPGGEDPYEVQILLYGKNRREQPDYSYFEHKINAQAFGRMLAKTAYTYALGARICPFDGREILAYINGKTDNGGDLVGDIIEDIAWDTTRLHKLDWRRRGPYVTVIVHLFASLMARPYEVVVGRGL